MSSFAHAAPRSFRAVSFASSSSGSASRGGGSPEGAGAAGDAVRSGGGAAGDGSSGDAGSSGGAGSAGAPGPSGGDGIEGLTVLGPVSRTVARDHGLVLSSMQIPHQVRSIPGGWILLVRDRDYRRAATAIDRYEEENRDWPPRQVRDTPRFPLSPVFAIGFLALAAFFAFVTGPVAHPQGAWFAEGRSVAAQLGSEPWRVVTALTLHADGAHVMGNVVSGTVFGTAVGRRLGPGLGALAVVASGAMGNAANALYYLTSGEHHASIGASTAVFGAVGILAATQLVALAFPRRGAAHAGDAPPRRWYEWAAPVLGGLGLLGALGASPSSDLGAHGFGIAAGLVVGLVAAGAAGVAARLGRRARGARRWSPLQLTSGAAALGTVLGAWMLALRV